MHILVASIKCKIYILFLISTIYLWYSKKLKVSEIYPYFLFFLANISLVFFIYFLADHPDWKIYISTTADRLLLQTSGIFLLFIYDSLKNDIYFKKV